MGGDLLRRHIRNRTFQPGHGVTAHQVGDTEVDQFDRVEIHYKDVAGLDVPMNQAAVVDGLETAADLRQDFPKAFRGNGLAGRLDQLIQGHAGKQRHDEERLDDVLLFEFSDVEDFYDVGVVQVGEHSPFTEEGIEGRAALDVNQGLDSYVASNDTVECLVDQTHSTAAYHAADFVAGINDRGHCSLPANTKPQPGVPPQGNPNNP